jgi:hypothetical protein
VEERLRLEAVMGVLGLDRSWLKGIMGGVSDSHVSRLLSGERAWSSAQQARIAAALGWPEQAIGQLFEGGDSVDRVVVNARYARAQGHITAQELALVEELFGGTPAGLGADNGGSISAVIGGGG